MKMETLKSLSIFVGTGQCNANCSHCAGKIHRKYAPAEDGIIDKDLIYKTLRECYEKGAMSLSISSSGEPTLSPQAVTKTLELVNECKQENIKFSPINLYSNGIRIGEDKNFCDRFLSYWKSQGLTTIYVTVHDIDEKRNAEIYGIASYPRLETVISRIHNADLLMRANLVLSRKTIDNAEKFIATTHHLRALGADLISAWPVRNMDDEQDAESAPSKEELDKIEDWITGNPDCQVKLLREKSRILYQTSQKLTLFPDGTLSNTWCN